ncbi:hypothetical protein [Leifsonia sp. NPDC058230]|uniref:hypothetical protein n=1 Tax=Leifsonia sp. NPDC058230 TaxID=3346391 RepID=UPI0036DA48CC
MIPPATVREEFLARGPVSRLQGGRGTAWRAGDVVLKPLDVHPDELLWLDERARATVESDRLRLSLPLRSRARQLVVDGWSASPYVAGAHRPGMWMEIAEVAREFSALFADVERPAFIDLRMHAWAQADRLAFGEDEVRVPDAAPHVAKLSSARTEVFDPSCIVHGDLTGNVLFADSRSPAVIDLTIYWRPVAYSIAIVAIDAVCFEGAPLSLLETIHPAPQFGQYLIRALLFRIATDWLNGLPADHYRVYDDAVERVLELG